MENSFAKLISQAKSILILLPLRPNYDQVAAGLALYLSLSEGKNVNISCPTPMLVDVNMLVGVNKITQEVGNKNLIIKFKNYKPTDVERVIYDVEDSQFRLVVTPIPQVAPPSKDQVDLTYAGISADCVILIGGDSDSNFPDVASQDFAGTNLIHIGIKDISLTGGRQVISLAQPKSSVSEVVALIIKESDLKIDADIATNLLAGIENATNSFSGESLSGETFVLVGELMQRGGKRLPKNPQISQPLSRTNSGFPSRFSQMPFPKTNPFAQFPFTSSSMEFPQAESMQTKEDELQDDLEPAPTDWFKPKIYKGTSTN
ncbi:MAG: hypothetical protein NZM26_04555 [Patescibacteria group bacterium]|nr:hypothetical protein [Patescibacteria group bacterium]